MKTSIPRLRSIRYKDGRSLTVLRTKHEDVASLFSVAAQRAISENDSPMVGYALVTWHADRTIFPAYHNGQDSALQGGQVPQYVKDILLAEMAARWAKT